MNKKHFINFLISSNILSFGQFHTKSGRISPYFFNTANYNNGEALAYISTIYAEKLIKLFQEKSFPVLYGPAYKGIPLVVAVAQKLFEKYCINARFCFNRKEKKTYGEKGILVGYEPKKNDSVIILEDVITAGTAILESLNLLESFNVKIKGTIISIDRMEKGNTKKSALREIEEKTGSKVYSLISIQDIIDYMDKHQLWKNNLIKKSIIEYRKKYGA